mgnify:CR=1 FL=1
MPTQPPGRGPPRGRGPPGRGPPRGGRGVSCFSYLLLMPSFEPLTPRPLTLLLRSSFFSHRPVVPQEGGQPVALHHVAHPEEARPVGLRAVVVAVVDHRVHRLVVDEEEVHPGVAHQEEGVHQEEAHQAEVDHLEDHQPVEWLAGEEEDRLAERQVVDHHVVRHHGERLVADHHVVHQGEEHRAAEEDRQLVVHLEVVDHQGHREGVGRLAHREEGVHQVPPEVVVLPVHHVVEVRLVPPEVVAHLDHLVEEGEEEDHQDHQE